MIKLSRREKEVLLLTCQGLSAKEVGVLLGIARPTVDRHKNSLFSKLRVRSSIKLALVAIREGLLEPHGYYYWEPLDTDETEGVEE